jgi:hypothetical protein
MQRMENIFNVVRCEKIIESPLYGPVSCGWPVLRAVYAAKHPWAHVSIAIVHQRRILNHMVLIRETFRHNCRSQSATMIVNGKKVT